MLVMPGFMPRIHGFFPEKASSFEPPRPPSSHFLELVVSF
jgi:hypothetical protein